MTVPDPALVLVAHGSRDPRAAEVADGVVALLRARRPALAVSAAYLDHTAPDVLTALRTLADAGCTRAVLVPFLISEAFHTRVDLPAVRREAGEALPGLDVVQAPALGPHPLLLEAAELRLAEAGQEAGDPRTAVVLAAAGTSDPQALELLHATAAGWQQRGWWAVRAAFASASGPTVAEAVAELRRRGAPRVVVSPYVLAPGFLPDRIAAGAADADGLAAPLGACPQVADLVLQRYDETADAG